MIRNNFSKGAYAKFHAMILCAAKY